MMKTSVFCVLMAVYIMNNMIYIDGYRTNINHFDKKRVLFANKPSSDLKEGYGPIGSLIRQGPVPFFIRLVKPDTYEAAVNKYMLLEKCDRNTAQGNMDAYFQVI